MQQYRRQSLASRGRGEECFMGAHSEQYIRKTLTTPPPAGAGAAMQAATPVPDKNRQHEQLVHSRH